MSVEPPIKLNLKALIPSDPQKTNAPATVEEENDNKIPNLTAPEELLVPEEPVKITLPSQNESVSDKKETIPAPKEIKSHNISFADIKKQIDKKNSPTEKEIEVEEEIEKQELGEIPIEVPAKEIPSIGGVDGIIKKSNGTISTTEQTAHENVEKDSIKPLDDNTKPVSSSDTDIQGHITLDPSVKSESLDKIIKNEETSVLDNSDKDKLVLENAEKAKSILREKEAQKIEKKKKFFSFFKRKKGDKNTKKKDKKKNSVVIKNDINDPKIANLEENTVIEDNTIPKKVEKVHFSNYESHFKKESTNFLKRFQKFKYAPTTRLGLIIGLISLTVLSIASLMIIFPEKHSLDIYKASIIQLTTKSDEEAILNEGTQTTPSVPEDNTQIEDNEKYEEIVENKNNSNTNSTSQEKSKEILRQHLLNKYK